MPPVPTKSRRRVKMTLEETILQEDMQMMSRMQKAMDIIKGSQGKNTSEVHQDKLHLLGTEVYFFHYCYSCTNFGHMAKD